MINRVASSIIPKAASTLASGAGKHGGRLKKALQNPVLHKVLDTAQENQLLINATYALALCCIARPLTNYAITKDKQDAGYASSHSIASGVMGFIWPMIFATPLAMGVRQIAKNPQKILKPSRIKQFYPNVKIVDELDAAGKKIGEKVATNAKGEMLTKNDKVLCKSLEPLMLYGDAERAAFEAKNAGFYVDKGGVVRSRTVFKTENGKFKLDKDGNKVGCAVQGENITIDKNGDVFYQLAEKDADGNNKKALLSTLTDRELTPITEEMEIGVKKEQNMQKFINMVPDTILAVPRAYLTIKLIPPILKALGIEKKPKQSADNQAVTKQSPITMAMRKAELKNPFVSFKKGGV